MRFLQVLVLLTFTALPAAAERHALVIGNDAYRNVGTLDRAVADARAIGDFLKTQGYFVTQVQDADRLMMLSAITSFTRRIKPGDTAVVYFAGHSVTLGRWGASKVFVLPVDLSGLKPDGGRVAELILSEKAFLWATLLNDIGKKGPALLVSILDACRNNPFDGRPAVKKTAITIGPAKSAKAGATFEIFASGPAACPIESLGKGDDHATSPFLRTLVKHLATGAPLEQVMDKVQREVSELTAKIGKAQVPHYTDGSPGPTCVTKGCGAR